MRKKIAKAIQVFGSGDFILPFLIALICFVLGIAHLVNDKVDTAGLYLVIAVSWIGIGRMQTLIKGAELTMKGTDALIFPLMRYIRDHIEKDGTNEKKEMGTETT